MNNKNSIAIFVAATSVAIAASDDLSQAAENDLGGLKGEYRYAFRS